MRTVAVVLALLTLIPMFPTGLAADECANPGAAGSFCVPFEVERPTNLPPGTPNLPDTPYFGKYYLWIGAGHCVSPTSGACRGVPAGPNPGVYAPTAEGGWTTVGAAVFGVLYEESNGLHGLQRSFTTRAADRMVLV